MEVASSIGSTRRPRLSQDVVLVVCESDSECETALRSKRRRRGADPDFKPPRRVSTKATEVDDVDSGTPAPPEPPKPPARKRGRQPSVRLDEAAAPADRSPEEATVDDSAREAPKPAERRGPGRPRSVKPDGRVSSTNSSPEGKAVDAVVESEMSGPPEERGVGDVDPEAPEAPAPKRGRPRSVKTDEAVAPANRSPEKETGPFPEEAAVDAILSPEEERVGDLDAEAEALRSPALQPGRHQTAKADEPVASASRPAEEETPEPQSFWSALPPAVLSRTFCLLGNADVISAGQTCRSWRTAAKLPSVWRRRRLAYDVAPSASGHLKHWLADARQFTRTVRFAPCLQRVYYPKTLPLAARRAIRQSACEVTSAELNGQRKGTQTFISCQKNLVDLALVNPNAECLKAALKAPRLASLAVAYDRATSECKSQGIGTVPSGTTGNLRKLTCHPGVGLPAVEALVLANAATLEEVGVHCLPADALLRCERLRHLLVRVRPGHAADEAKLRRLLQERQPLDFLAFIGTRGHAQAPCEALRASLGDRVGTGAVLCCCCDGVCAQQRPVCANRVAPEDQDDAELDVRANVFRLSGHCQCVTCRSATGDHEDDDDDSGEETEG
ncbi:uncharacterized protein LOC117642619 [Thrips palmi]|uniref:Uncharacterized protein LOC117642619 n=1 Tax=Thrips palmi TaxID=161013 RepID=A0A6P8YIL8_THRPL|nr:uncharacterized protein LOC117642619 [Thrips palmi]XP_034236843.1 uncharacterized protein LOC117642619 [Thrips palmi]XP_034236844.1 uncharacterized protein LOC117642619 [Thrips palmi]XP_034236845.1 uncharacterized protein LOC117642619 [Thrips palmi]XP_034236846.1 uncharacterized protein LOC117642619 [Thrips palmi]XP_034236847.1 uncharacterized protein LOC117642619 [Thrips palmi]XP_034236849.1 uncharacterized protein LOC117642619 [Thrips palmi]XP_034236850.1 uncharacterized protein LOC1176